MHRHPVIDSFKFHHEESAIIEIVNPWVLQAGKGVAGLGSRQ